MNSKTPRTDAAKFEINWTNQPGYRCVVSSELSEQLESELNAQIEANRILSLRELNAHIQGNRIIRIMNQKQP